MQVASSHQHRGAVIVELTIVIVALLIFLFCIYEIGTVLNRLVTTANSTYLYSMAGVDDIPIEVSGVKLEGRSMMAREGRLEYILNRDILGFNISGIFNVEDFDDAILNLPKRSFRVRFAGSVPIISSSVEFGLGAAQLPVGDTILAPYILPAPIVNNNPAFVNPIPSRQKNCSNGVNNNCITGCLPPGAGLATACRSVTGNPNHW